MMATSPLFPFSILEIATYHELTRHGTRCRLFDFLQVHTEEGIEEIKDFFTGGKVCSVHHAFLL